MRISKGPWRYEYGEVVGDNGDTIARRSVEHSPNTSPVQRDTDLAAVALLPEVIELAERFAARWDKYDEQDNPELGAAIRELMAKLRKIQED